MRMCRLSYTNISGFCRYKSSRVAVKMMFCHEITPDIIVDFTDEATHLHTLRSAANPNPCPHYCSCSQSGYRSDLVCQLVGVSVVPPAMCHIIELYELGSLRDWVENGRELGKEECSSTLFRLQLARSCAQAVEFLHSRSIVISDCKSPNFLVKLDGTCVICDLGSCFVYREAEERESFVGRWRQYSSNWAAPEILDGMMFTYASDCYALAIVLWEIESGGTPFDGLSFIEVETAILAGERPPLDALDDTVNKPALSSLVSSGWDKDVSRRPPAATMVQVLDQLCEDARNTPSNFAYVTQNTQAPE